MSNKPLVGKVCLVTGATRGIGKGIALQLGEAGATVYITGRTLKSKGNGLGSLEETANEIRNRGGKCVPCQVDHEVDTEIAALFEQIKNEQNGILDVLVNNAYKGVNTIFEGKELKFWEQKPEVWDEINNVGLRNHYICTVYAARIMVPRKQGLIINISSFGGLHYLFNVPYGVGKAACDRMAIDCGIELRKQNVCMLSLYPGAVKTELIVENLQKASSDSRADKDMHRAFNGGESIEYSGRVVVALAQDKNIMKYTSKIVICSEYAESKSIVDIDNRTILSFREVRFLAEKVLPPNFQFLASFIPRFVKIPTFVIDLYTSKL